MNHRTYSITTDTVVGWPVPVLVVSLPVHQMPFGVWRDVGRLAGSSVDHQDRIEFRFIGYNAANQQKRLAQAESLLQGALFSKVEQ